VHDGGDAVSDAFVGCDRLTLPTGNAELEGSDFVCSSEVDCRALKTPMLEGTTGSAKVMDRTAVRGVCVCAGSRGPVVDLTCSQNGESSCLYPQALLLECFSSTPWCL
jgi:hypothetical protein